MTAPLIHCFTTATGTGASVTITKPGAGSTAGPDGAKNPVSGDYLLAVILNDSTSASESWTPPDGSWTQIPQGDVGNGTSDAHVTAFIKKLDGTEGASFGFSSGAALGIVGCLILLSGVHATQADAINGTGSEVIDSTPPIAITGFTSGVADVLAIAIYAYDGADDGGYSVSGTGWTELLEMRRGTSSANESGGVSYRKMSGIAATGTVTITPGLSDGMAGTQFGIAPVVPGVFTVSPDPMRMDEAAGSVVGLGFGGSPGSLYISDAATLAGSANEVDISAAIDGWSDTSIGVDLTLLGSSTLEALHNLGPGARFMIVDGTAEYSLGFTLKRPIAIVLSASTHIAASGEATTPQLTAPAGKDSGDHTAGRIQDDENPTDSINIGSGGYTEIEFCLAFTDQALLDEPYVLELLFEGADLNSESVTPTVTPVIGSQQIAVGASGEAEAADPVSVVKPIFVGVASAVHGEVAQPIDPLKPLIEAVSAAVESEAAQGVEALKPILEAVLAVSEAEVAQVVDPVKPIFVSVDPAVESEVARGVAPSTVVSVLQASETEVSRAVAAAKRVTIGVASEVEFAAVIGALKPILEAVGQASEAEVAQAIEVVKTIVTEVDPAGESEVARALEAVKPIFVVVDPAVETETAQPIDTSVDRMIAVAAAGEAEMALGVTVVKPQVVDVLGAVEGETAHSVAPVKPIFVDVGRASEVEAAQGVGVDISRLIVVGSASEVETGWMVAPVKPIILPVSAVTELEIPSTVGTGKTVAIDAVGELEEAQVVLADKPITMLVGSVQESELAVVTFPVKPIFVPVGSVFETEVVTEADYQKRIPVDGVLEIETVTDVLIDKPIFVTMTRITESEVALEVAVLVIGEIAVEPGAQLFDVQRNPRGLGVKITGAVVEAVEGGGVTYKPVVVVRDT